jgi:hypothetical protein
MNRQLARNFLKDFVIAPGRSTLLMKKTIGTPRRRNARTSTRAEIARPRLLMPSGALAFSCWRSLQDNELDRFPPSAAGMHSTADESSFSFADPKYIRMAARNRQRRNPAKVLWWLEFLLAPEYGRLRPLADAGHGRRLLPSRCETTERRPAEATLTAALLLNAAGVDIAGLLYSAALRIRF